MATAALALAQRRQRRGLQALVAECRRVAIGTLACLLLSSDFAGEKSQQHLHVNLEDPRSTRRPTAILSRSTSVSVLE
jgi:hypothetical protein